MTELLRRHNANTMHTHDVEQYDPLIDNCGLETLFMPGLTLYDCDGITNASATIMSYCHMVRADAGVRE